MTEKNKKAFCRDQLGCKDYKGFACCDCLADGLVFECKYETADDAKDNCTSYRPLAN